jgi:N-acetyl-anhydromuramoyl-L-alanine amidase
MKWLLFIGIMMALIVWWRRAYHEQNERSSAKPQLPAEMSRCPYCGLRFPKDNTFKGYCSFEHQHQIDPKGWWGMAEWVPSPNYDERSSGSPIDLVLIHHISLPPGEFGGSYIADFFQNKLNPLAHPYFADIADRQVSSHFFISRDGHIQQFVATEKRAWHAGVSNFFGKERCNDFSIGIELEGCDVLPFEVAQYEALAILVLAIKQKYPVIAFAGHSDVAPGRKTDPGIHFDWAYFANLAKIPGEEMPYGIQKR